MFFCFYCTKSVPNLKGIMATITKRENKKGVTYKVVIRKKGYSTASKTFERKSDAQAWANDIESQMNKGSYREIPSEFVVDDNKTLESMKDLILYFKKNVAPKKYSNDKMYHVMFDWWIDKIGSIKIKEIAPHNLTYCKHLLQSEKITKKNGVKVNRKNGTINKYLMCISAVLSFAVDELNIIEHNPMQKVKILPLKNNRTRFLSVEEIKMFLDACKNYSDRVYLFALIALSSGARYSEVLNLRVNNIDFVNAQLFFLDTKNKEHRGVPVNHNLISTIQSFIKNYSISDYLFINSSTNKLYRMRAPITKIIENLKFEDFHIHDLRHTTASYIAMNGGSLLDIAEILGHKSLVMARRYSHLTQKHTAIVLNKVTDKIIPNV